MTLAAYFDDSGTHDDSRVVVWGGLIGTCEQWTGFDAAWRAKLAKPLDSKPPLRKFHLADCQNGYGEFWGYPEPARDLLQNEFRQIIIDHRLIGFAYAVDRVAWDRLASSDAVRRYFGDAETVCFGSCFNGSIERAERFFRDETMLSLHFDTGENRQSLTPSLTAFWQPTKARHLQS